MNFEVIVNNRISKMLLHVCYILHFSNFRFGVSDKIMAISRVFHTEIMKTHCKKKILVHSGGLEALTKVKLLHGIEKFPILR